MSTVGGSDVIDAVSSRNAIPPYLKLVTKDVDDIIHHLEIAAVELWDNGPNTPDKLFISSCIFLQRHIASPLGTRDSFFTENHNENVRIPTYFPYRGILVCSLDYSCSKK
jgi:hypothetical protein